MYGADVAIQLGFRAAAVVTEPLLFACAKLPSTALKECGHVRLAYKHGRNSQGIARFNYLVEVVRCST